MVIQIDELLSERSLLSVFDENELGKMGFEKRELDLIKEDSHQDHPKRRNGFLGALVVNFLHRRGSLNGQVSNNYISAYLASEALGMDFDAIMEMRNGERPLVTERDVGGINDLYISVGDLHLCTKDSNLSTLTELATNYAQTKNPWTREQIATIAQKNVEGIAKGVFKKVHGRVQLDDLVCDGNLGLLEAIESYDPSRGTKFETHMQGRVYGAMIDGLRGVDLLSRVDRTRLKTMSEFAEQFKKKSDREPGLDDYKQEWEDKGYPEDSFEHFYYDVLNLGKIKSLNDIVAETDGGKRIERGYLIEASLKIIPLRSLQSNEAKEIFEKDLGAIPKKYREVLRLYLLEGVPLKEAGESVGVSESRASQIKTQYVNSGVFFRRTREYLGIPIIEEVTLKLD